MSRAARTHKYADGRQSRSGSGARGGAEKESEISCVSVVKSPRANRQAEQDASMEYKRRKLAEDMAKA